MHVNVLHYYITLHHPVRFNLAPCFPAGLILMVCGSGVGVRLKVGANIEKIEGVGSGEGLCPRQLGGCGLAPRKKINLALKIMQFWASFGTYFLLYSRKWGFILQS